MVRRLVNEMDFEALETKMKKCKVLIENTCIITIQLVRDEVYPLYDIYFNYAGIILSSCKSQ